MIQCTQQPSFVCLHITHLPTVWINVSIRRLVRKLKNSIKGQKAVIWFFGYFFWQTLKKDLKLLHIQFILGKHLEL